VNNADGQNASAFAILAVTAIFIAFMVNQSIVKEEETCDSTCAKEGYHSLRVSKGASCLCYDSNGYLRVPKGRMKSDD
jgi:hypothetical protein